MKKIVIMMGVVFFILTSAPAFAGWSEWTTIAEININDAEEVIFVTVSDPVVNTNQCTSSNADTVVTMGNFTTRKMGNQILTLLSLAFATNKEISILSTGCNGQYNLNEIHRVRVR